MAPAAHLSEEAHGHAFDPVVLHGYHHALCKNITQQANYTKRTLGLVVVAASQVLVKLYQALDSFMNH